MVDTETRMRELEHRFRNILTIVRSLVSQSLQRAESIEDARSTIDERLAALGGAIEQLLAHDWEAAPLPALAENALAHFTLGAGRMRLAGPTVTIGPKAAITLTLAFHELATNAIKYGALSNVSNGVQKGPPIGVEEGPLFGYDVGLLKMALRCVRRRAGVARPEARAAQDRFLKAPKVAVSCGF